MVRLVQTTIAALLIAAAGAGGYQYYLSNTATVRAQKKAEQLTEQLTELRTSFDALSRQYNEAVTRTAVTELHVRDGRLSVVVRTIDGDEKRIDTPYDPSGEIYVDYVVMRGRLWIRRVFDARTPPDQALVIDPSLGTLDWNDTDLAHGKAVYRRLDEGAWIITVTGDGSLGLARCDDSTDYELSGPPVVRQYEPLTTHP
mgnify:CR=1 FL=1